MNLIELISDLKKRIKQSIIECQVFFDIKFKFSKIDLEFPERRIHGDISTNAALKYAKCFRLMPFKFASFIIKNLEKPDYIKRIEFATPGFINFFLDSKFFFETLINIDCERENYGRTSPKNKKILVEFVSSNPTGPMHIGNARLGVLGDSLSEALKFVGFEVCKEFYVNDSGNQIQKFADSIAARYLQIFDPSVEFPEDGYHGDYIKNFAKEFKNACGDSYYYAYTEDKYKNKEILKNNILSYVLPISIKRMQQNLSNYKINYDNWFYESSLYESGLIDSVLKQIESKGATYNKDNAVWFKATDFGADKDEVLVRNNGIPTYFAADVAYHVNKFLIRKFDICVNFLGADHQGHIARMHAAMDCLGINPEKLVFIIVQLVRIIDKGKIIMMSKRKGKIETLEDFIDQINVDSSRFMFNMQDANSAMDFDIDATIRNDNNNPSYYVKYACVRIQSILKLFEKIPEKRIVVFELLNSEIEEQLMFELSKFPYVLNEVVDLMDSTKIARYVVNLAAIFHKYYNNYKIKSDNYCLSNARGFLCLQILRIMKSVLQILKIDLPTNM